MSSRTKKGVAKCEVHIHSTLRRTWNTSGYGALAQSVLEPGYELSVVLVGDRRARALNTTYRGKTYAANVLSFPLSPERGEIFLNIAKVCREAKRFGLSPEGHARFLLIHGCLHLKGYTHGSTMEEAEQRLCERFNIR